LGVIKIDTVGTRLNLLFVSDVSISDVIGGAERVLFEQCVGMSQRGHKVHVLTRWLPYHHKKHETIQGVEEWRYNFNQRNPAAFLYTTCLNARKLFEYLQNKYFFDCINFHQPFSALGINLSEVSRAWPKVYTCHSLSFEEFSTREKNGNGIIRTASNFLKIQAIKKIEKYGLNNSNVIAVLSRFTQDKLVDAYNIPIEKIKTIPGGVDLKKFHPADDKATIRKQLNIPQNKIILFTVRNLVQRMGLENLIIAFHELEKEASDIELVIGGKGPLENRLIALARSFGIEQKIHFAGFISEEQLPLYYQMADIFVLPTKELEGFGLVTLEAIASGVPVLGTPVGGTEEILGTFDSRFLFKGTDPHSMADLILENYKLIKQNPEKWGKISRRCRNFVERNYSWEQNIDALEKLFTKKL
jgi:glycosyltransferase involved in cell wall biosynthesis